MALIIKCKPWILIDVKSFFAIKGTFKSFCFLYFMINFIIVAYFSFATKFEMFLKLVFISIKYFFIILVRYVR